MGWLSHQCTCEEMVTFHQCALDSCSTLNPRDATLATLGFLRDQRQRRPMHYIYESMLANIHTY